jgi:hypothetical protein
MPSAPVGRGLCVEIFIAEAIFSHPVFVSLLSLAKVQAGHRIAC